MCRLRFWVEWVEYGVSRLKDEGPKDVISYFIANGSGRRDQIAGVSGRPNTNTVWQSCGLMRPGIEHFGLDCDPLDRPTIISDIEVLPFYREPLISEDF